MQQTYPAEAIVLDRTIFREYDSRITVYSREHGLLDLVAKGAKRFKSKMSGHIEPITHIKLMVAKGKQYDYLASAVNQNTYHRVKYNFDVLLDCGRALKMCKKNIKPGISDERIFLLLIDYLNAINHIDMSASKSQFYLASFVLKFSSLLGYGLQLKNCLCGKLDKSKNIYVSYDYGGLVCDECKTRSKHRHIIDINALEILRKIMSTKANQHISMSKKDVEKIFNISQYHLKYSMECEL